MQAAIDRVIRTFSFRSQATVEDQARPAVSHDEAVSLAARLLENYRIQLAQNAVTKG